jgi:tetratricopeptide (TPR) repeat protein
MTPIPALRVCIRLLGIAALFASVAPGAISAQIPDEFTNLKLFPAEIEKRQLTGIMRSFTEALGVRCNHCHVGENPDSLDGYDFASDEKEAKRIARVMLRMSNAINDDFLPETGRENVAQVRCVTCHRGIRKPVPLKNVVLAAAEEGGIEGAAAEYRALREKHFGAGAYDFGPASLDGVTEALAMQKGDFEGAAAINDLNLEFHPESAYTLYLRARLLLRGGDRDGAIAALEKAIAANPEEGWLAGQLEEIKNPPAEE